MRGLLGKHLSHSFSKIIHELLENEPYHLIEKDEVSFLSDKDFNYLNVTIPYKKDVIPYIDYISDEAKEIGAVNTIINKDNKLYGYNTDYYGLDYLLTHFKVDYKNKKIAIFGNGGAASTIKYLLKNEKYYVFDITNDTEDYSNKELLSSIEVIFNATPANMYPNNYQKPLINKEDVPNLETVIDLVYNPLTTPIMTYAKNSYNGLLMLVYQAVKACELYYNKTYSKQQVLNIYNKLLLEKLNISFIGMPMSGKTYTSELLSKHLNKELKDIDSMIEEHEQTSINNIFKQFGESYFREIETQILKETAIKNNLVISPGGGIIKSEENINILKQNAVVIFLDMSLETLKNGDFSTRPLLKDHKALIDLYDTRYCLYEKYADIIIKRDTYEDDIVERVMSSLYEYLSN